MSASLFLRAASWVAIARAALAAAPDPPPRRHLGDDDRGADVGDPAGAARRAGQGDGARAPHRPDARDVPGPARDARLADGAQHRRPGPAGRDHRLHDRPLPLEPEEALPRQPRPAGCCSWPSSSRPPSMRGRRVGPGRAGARGGQGRAGPGAERSAASSATRAAGRSPPARSSRRGPCSCSPARRSSLALGLEAEAGIGACRGGPVRGQRHRGRPRDPVQHRHLPARGDQRAERGLRRQRRRRARLRRHPPGGRDRHRGRARPPGAGPRGRHLVATCACAR